MYEKNPRKIECHADTKFRRSKSSSGHSFTSVQINKQTREFEYQFGYQKVHLNFPVVPTGKFESRSSCRAIPMTFPLKYVRLEYTYEVRIWHVVVQDFVVFHQFAL